jgi:hypothetical protein
MEKRWLFNEVNGVVADREPVTKKHPTPLDNRLMVLYT